jgi:hypothetical protein
MATIDSSSENYGEEWSFINTGQIKQTIEDARLDG